MRNFPFKKSIFQFFKSNDFSKGWWGHDVVVVVYALNNELNYDFLDTCPLVLWHLNKFYNTGAWVL